VTGPVVRPWEDKWFGDGFSHLNPAGAERFSAQFEGVLKPAAVNAVLEHDFVKIQ
jgi:hypothetical protein